MNSFLKSAIIYFELLLLILYFSVTNSVTLDYYSQGDQKSHLAFLSNYQFSDIIYIRDNHQTNVERSQQSNTSKLFQVNVPLTIVTLNYFVVLRNQTLITHSTPDYLLSSDLKSPPKNL